MLNLYYITAKKIPIDMYIDFIQNYKSGECQYTNCIVRNLKVYVIREKLKSFLYFVKLLRAIGPLQNNILVCKSFIKYIPIELLLFTQNVINTLYILDANIKTFPNNIYLLKDLNQLNCINNKIYKLPDTIGRLHNLTRLVITNNQLTTLPSSISHLTNLKHLFR